MVMPSTIDDDAALAAELARGAGQVLLTIRESGLSGTPLGDAGDHAANAWLVAALRERRPNDGLLSEEMRCDGRRLGHERVWIVDPVDGTREYGEGRSDWAVHVALAIDGVAVVGAVALPVDGRVLVSHPPQPLGPAPARLRMVVSRSRPPAVAVAVARSLGADLVPLGSAGAKAMAVVLGEASIYLHLGGQHEWDSAAPVAVAMGHGLHCSRIDGTPLRYNNADTRIPDLLICRPELAEPVIAATAAALRQG